MNGQHELTLADIFFDKAILLTASAKYNEAFKLLQKANTVYIAYKRWENYVKTLHQIAKTWIAAQKMDEVLSYLELALQTNKEKLDLNTILLTETYRIFADYYEANNKLENANYYYQEIANICEEKFGSFHQSLAESYYKIGMIYFVKDDIEKALNFLQKSLEIYIGLEGESHVNVATIYNTIGECYNQQSNYDLGLVYLEKALNLSLDLPNINYEEIAGAYNNLGVTYYQQNKYGKAINHLQKSLEIKQEHLGLDDFSSDVEKAYNNLAACYMAKGAYREAILYNQKSLLIKIRVFGEQHHKLAEIYQNIGSCYANNGDYHTAIDYFSQALEILKQAFGEVHQEVATAFNHLGDCYLRKEDLDQALFFNEKALALRLQLFSPHNAYIGSSNNSLGLCFFKKGQHDKALEYQEKALHIWLKNVGYEHEKVAQTYNFISEIWIEKGEQSKALEYAYLALDILLQIFGKTHPLTAACYHRIGTYLSDKGEYEQAFIYLESALKYRLYIFDEEHILVAESYTNIGQLYLRTANYSEALNYFLKALNIREEKLDSFHPDLATSYSHISSCYYYEGDYENVLLYLDKTIAIRLQNFGEDHHSVVTGYNNMGHTYIGQQDFDKALDYCKKAEAIANRIFTAHNPILGHSYNTIGTCYFEKKSYEVALNYFQKALEIWKQSYDNHTHPNIALVYSNMATCYGSLQNYRRALSYNQKALNIRIQVFGKYHPEVASSYSNLASYYFEQKDTTKALNYVQKALMTLVIDYNNIYVYDNPKLESYSSALSLLKNLQLKAEIFTHLYYQNNKEKELNLKMAFETYLLAGELIDQIMQGYKAEGSKLMLGQKVVPIYEQIILLALELYDHSKDEAYLRQAFYCSEKGKGIVLFSHLKDAEAKAKSKIPPALIEQEQILRKDLTNLDKHINNEKSKGEKADGNKIKQFQERHFSLNQQYQTFVSQLENEYTEYYNLKYRIKSVSISDLQNILGVNTYLISYFIGERDIIIFSIQKNKFSVKKITQPSHFTQLIEDFNETIEDVSRKAFIGYAYSLYELLLQPILGNALPNDNLVSETEINKNLIIIPDDELAHVPFEPFLCQKMKKQTPYTTLPYLIKYFNISYHYSATLFYYTSKRQATRSFLTESFIGFAPVYTKHLYKSAPDLIPIETSNNEKLKETLQLYNKKYQELIYSKHEVHNISLLFKKEGISAQTLFHGTASKTNFLKYIGNHKYVHVAAHGLLNKKEPSLSGIIFHPEKGETFKENAVFHISDAYHLDLKTDLMVLSSCESGIGNLVKGEGMMTINRGFLYAGVSNIVFTLFKVYDRPSFELTQIFYQDIVAGKNYAQALRKAKLHLIKQKNSTPLSWAGFVLIGV
ncbi:MAG: CHAT domain-containing protein [Chitinophagales bacterium]